MKAAAFAVIVALVPARSRASDFWESLVEPGLVRFRSSLRSGKAHFERGEWGQALVHFERAAAAMPDRAEAHRLRGDCLYRLERWEPALEAWTRARGEDGLLAYDPQLSFDFAMAATKAGRLADAIEEYRRLLAATGSGHRLRSVSLSNCAELVMAAGPERIEEAIASYRGALEESRANVLADWGLALALDRAGRPEEAAGSLDRLRRSDPRLAALASDDVFFVPPEEEHAYRAIGLAAFGNLAAAEAAWDAFLGGGGAAGPWADHARERLDAVRDRIAREPPRPEARRLP